MFDRLLILKAQKSPAINRANLLNSEFGLIARCVASHCSSAAFC